jgi:hypothetical protein
MGVGTIGSTRELGYQLLQYQLCRPSRQKTGPPSSLSLALTFLTKASTFLCPSLLIVLLPDIDKASLLYQQTFLIMSTATPKFSKQQDLAQKRISDLEDHEKIYMLKKEIDNLRKQVRESGALQAPQSTASATPQIDEQGFCGRTGFCMGAPMLTIVLVLGLALVVRWRRRTTRKAHAPEMTLQFELQDAHDYEAPNAAEVLFF